MEIALWICMIPLIWVLVAKFAIKKAITWKEAALQGSGVCLLVLIIFGAMMFSNSSDHLVLNGEVTGKKKTWVSCSHSYSCNCRQVCSGSGSSRSCSTVCDTCYEHSNDWDWNVHTTVGTKTINRVDRRGSETPPRWTAVVIGEPAASMERYTNYVLAAPNSLFNMQLAETEAQTKVIPAYPEVYDYYRVMHTITVGASVPNVQKWDELLDNELRKLGAQKQVNIIMVFVKGQGREYASTLERGWLGGKKNDVVIVVGTEGIKIDWVEVFTFGKTSGNGMLAVQLRDNMQALGTTEDAAAGVAIIVKDIRSHFRRKEMADYEYLKSEGGPSSKQLGWLFGILLVVLIVSTFLLWKYDVFKENRYINRFYR